MAPTAQRKVARVSNALEKFSSVDSRHALKLCEMSCVALRLRMDACSRRRCAVPIVVSYRSDAAREVTVDTVGSLLQGRVLERGRRPCD